MKMSIESTPKIVHVNGVPTRVWQGETERGTPVLCFVVRVAAPKDADNAELERDLQEHEPPRPEVQAIDPRLLL